MNRDAWTPYLCVFACGAYPFRSLSIRSTNFEQRKIGASPCHPPQAISKPINISEVIFMAS
jgi:hypothetical protein